MATVALDPALESANPTLPPALRPLGLHEVSFTRGFWHDLQTLNHDAVIPHCEHWIDEMGWAANFDRAASGEPFEHAGIEFTDSEVYKLLEAMAIEIDRTADEELERRYTALVARVAAAQDDDGYLHTAFGRPWQQDRYSDLQWGHELYCFGHLFQAAAARIRSGRGGLLPEVADRLAAHVCAEMGPAGRVAICGHPEIEMALTELWEATGERRHLELARVFVERRGHGLLGDIEWGRSYFQDDEPIREASVLRGHAVRALYLAAGALDVARGTGDEDLWAAVAGQYDRTIARRAYVTGGVGSHHQDEAFGEDFELPPDRAYAETCAAIASIRVAQRLLEVGGEPRYADLVERTLLNAVLVSPRADGRAFFYCNTLHQRAAGVEADENRASSRANSSLRAPWFEVSCCPTNLARTLAGLPAYVAGVGADGLVLHQYGSYRIRTADAAGLDVAVDVESDFPRDGSVSVTLRTDLRAEQRLLLRVPGWACEPSRVEVNGEARPVSGSTITIAGPLPEGTTIVADFAMAATMRAADPRVDAVRGQVVVERGPVVYAIEDVDLPAGITVNDVRIDADEPLEADDAGITAVLLVPVERPDVVGPAAHDVPRQAMRVRLRPYAQRGNRGPATMRVFIPTASQS